MSFIDPLFFVFLLPVLTILALSRGRVRLLCLVVASYLFYAAAYPPFALILLIGTIFDYWIGERIHVSANQRRRKIWLAASIAANIGVLVGFKYTPFIVENINAVVAESGFSLPVPVVAVPLGISFFTFQSLSYTIDIYRRTILPTTSFLKFASFISFFPHLVAGPIIRARDYLPQLPTLSTLKTEESWLGIGLILSGYFKKCVVADNIAPLIDPIFANPELFGGLAHWLSSMFFAIQIYADFSGYTDIATGLSLLIGVRLRENFHWPYLSPSIREFWRRWHMSLSFFLRDYLYFSMGGDRAGKWHTIRNVLVVWFLGGLWHGAAWHFVAWGLYHGTAVSIGRLFETVPWSKATWTRLPLAVSVSFTFITVCIGWVFFRAAKLSDAFVILSSMAQPLSSNWSSGVATFAYLPIILGGGAAAAHILTFKLFSKYPQQTLLTRVSPIWRPIAVTCTIAIIIIFAGDRRTFIYFNF